MKNKITITIPTTENKKLLIYNEYIKKGVFMPKLNSNAITEESLFYCGNSLNFILFSSTEIKRSDDKKLIYSKEMSYQMLQRLIHSRLKKILPFKGIPDYNFILDLICFLDQENEHKLFRMKKDDDEEDEAIKFVKNNKEIKRKDRAVIKKCVNSLKKYYSFTKEYESKFISHVTNFASLKLMNKKLVEDTSEFENNLNMENKIIYRGSDLYKIISTLTKYFNHLSSDILKTTVTDTIKGIDGEHLVEDFIKFYDSSFKPILSPFEDRKPRTITGFKFSDEALDILSIKELYENFGSSSLDFINYMYSNNKLKDKHILELQNLITDHDTNHQKEIDEFIESIKTYEKEVYEKQKDKLMELEVNVKVIESSLNDLIESAKECKSSHISLRICKINFAKLKQKLEDQFELQNQEDLKELHETVDFFEKNKKAKVEFQDYDLFEMEGDKISLAGISQAHSGISDYDLEIDKEFEILNNNPDSSDIGSGINNSRDARSKSKAKDKEKKEEEEDKDSESKKESSEKVELKDF